MPCGEQEEGSGYGFKCARVDHSLRLLIIDDYTHNYRE